MMNNGNIIYLNWKTAYLVTPIMKTKELPTMSDIKIIKNATDEQLEEMGVNNWPIWEKETSSFPWSYDSNETCYFLDGDVIVTPEGGQPVAMGKGDLVTFPSGMSCTWEIRSPVRKHYNFS
jgi:hypothetical protein